MKIVELINNLTIALTNEEQDLLLKFSDAGASVARRELNEREVVVANSMVNKDVLYRKNQDGRITYHKKSLS
jgi:hypothetical protein